MKFNNLLILATTLLLVSACNKATKATSDKTNQTATSANIRYARGFKLERFADYTLITVRNPWDTTRVMEKYVLVDRNKKTPSSLPEGTVVQIPVQRVALCSAIFAGEYQQLGELDKIVAVSDPEYINIREITTKIQRNEIANLGMTSALKDEQLIASKSEILIVSPFEIATHDKYKKNGICIVKDASYMEETPLGRAEWLKFEAAFIGKDSIANSIFSSIEKRYNNLCQQVKTTKNRPTVFTELKSGDAWYVAGGNSFISNFLKDAGANYLWNDMKMTGSKPLPVEAVYSKAINADYWLIKYNASTDKSLEQLGNEYALYKNFAAYKNGNVFAVNSGKTPFYEVAPLEPDVVLADMVKIFHPELLPNYSASYYFKMK